MKYYFAATLCVFSVAQQLLPTIDYENLNMSEAKSGELCDIGLYGLAVMGQNFALNMASHGFRVAVSNRSPSKVSSLVL